MSRSKRLQIVLELAEKSEKKAVDALEMARAQQQQDEQKLQELNQYYEDYEEAFRSPKPMIRAEEMQRQRSFLVQLSDARDQQNRVVEQRRVIYNGKQKLWQTAHLKRKAMADLISRLKHDEARLLSKQDEQMLDEWFNQTSQQRAERNLM